MAFVSITATSDDGGYWFLDQVGHVYAMGNAVYYGGDPSGPPGLFVAIRRTPSGGGYWPLENEGHVYAFGDANYFGGFPSGAGGPFVDLEPTADGEGYWLLDSKGQVYSYGNAIYHSSAPSSFTGSFISLAPTSSTDSGGYNMLDSAGEVFTYGDAQYYGGAFGAAYSGGFVAIKRTPSGDGYWLLTSTGQIYTHGSATYYGGAYGSAYTGRFVDMAVTSTGGGYWLLDSEGQVYSCGNAPYHGNEAPPEGCVNGVDSTRTAGAAASCFKDSGYEFIGRYLGGPCYDGNPPLSQSEVSDIRSKRLFVCSIYSGANDSPNAFCGIQNFAQGQSDANDAFSLAQALGPSPNQVLGQPPNSAIYLDIEANQRNSNSIAHAQGWCQRLATLGHQPGIYSSPSQLNVLRSQGMGWTGSTLLEREHRPQRGGVARTLPVSEQLSASANVAVRVSRDDLRVRRRH